VGLGELEKVTLQSWEHAVKTAARRAAALADQTITISIPQDLISKLTAERAVCTAVCSTIVGSYGPALYKEKQERFPFKQINVVASSNPADALERGRILGEAMNLTRELVNRQPEEIYPATFAQRAVEEATRAGISVDVFDLQRIQKERMGSLLGVARGSIHEPRVVVLKYQGAGADAPYLALCGKGVTFDSGGLSIKPSDSMVSMKADMAGGATVLGAMVALAQLKVSVNVLGVIGLVENMVGPHSYKLGEVLTARNGVTIEVHNTDAEGRLVLADVLAYAVEQKPTHLVDLATLTGSCVVALGMDIAGAFSNNTSWCDSVLAAAKQTGEELWPMPMNDSFSEQLKCDVADLKNVGTRWGGSITAAKFLERFVDETPWVHLDIAGPSWAESTKGHQDSGATASSLRTLVALAENFGAK